MKEQVLVADGIHTTMTEQHLDMFLQFLAGLERVVQALHQQILLGRQLARVLGVDSGEIVRTHLILLAIDDQHTTLVVNVV